MLDRWRAPGFRLHTRSGGGSDLSWLRGGEAFSAGPTPLGTIFGRSGAAKKGAA
jgi:hypothetical protein